MFQVCCDEQRILVTLDLDFANPLTFDPRLTAGVVVLRLTRSPAPSELVAAIATLLSRSVTVRSTDHSGSFDRNAFVFGSHLLRRMLPDPPAVRRSARVQASVSQ